MPGDGTPSDLASQYAYISSVYENVLGWYRDADRKAQLALTVNGVVVSVVAGDVLLGADAGRISVRDAPLVTQVLLLVAAVFIVCSLATATACLKSRLGEARIQRLFNQLGVDGDDQTTYEPAVAWWFGAIAQLRASAFADMISRSNTEFYRDALVGQVSILSEHVLRKHRWVNRAWLFLGCSFGTLTLALVTLLYQ